MSNPIWQAILNGLKQIVVDLENAIAQGAHKLWDIITAVFTAEETQIMADIKPMIQQIAIGLQNAQPGLNAQSFIPALVAAAIPVLEKEGVVLAHTAISTVASTVAHELSVPNDPGNAGNLGGGSTSSGANGTSATPAA